MNSANSVATGARCLVVDDDVQVRRALARVIQSQGLVCLEAGSGAEALTILDRDGEVPLCVSDINMPEMDGLTFLREALKRYPDMGIIMLSGVAEVNTAVECLQIGALDYISKPVMPEEVRVRVTKALEKRDLILQNRFYHHHLERRVRELDRRNRQSFINGVEMLAFAREAKDAYTSGHSLRVSDHAVKTALHLGFAGERLEEIRLGSRLHDIGKIGIREAVLNKPSTLTAEEYEHVKLHTTLGEKILTPFLRESATALTIVRSHHERFDGGGFPDGLAGDDIPIEARLVCAVDAFDAMTTSRAYRPPLSAPAAVEELKSRAGGQFDPAVVDAFLRVLRGASSFAAATQ